MQEANDIIREQFYGSSLSRSGMDGICKRMGKFVLLWYIIVNDCPAVRGVAGHT